MPRTCAVVLLILTTVAVIGPVAAADPAFTPTLDLRLRQEVLDGVYHFAPAEHQDRNWLRLRSRAGGRFATDAHRFELRLDNEMRHHIAPTPEADWEELIVDRALWSWHLKPGCSVTVGRQDIIWDDGFLVLEGHPLDGSRSIYHNAVRFQGTPGWGSFDAALVANTKRDDLVLRGDKAKPLSDADEVGAMLRLERAGWSVALIYKDEDDPDGVLPDLRTLTLGLRGTGALGGGGSWRAEFAVQDQEGPVASATEEGPTPDDGWALAGQAFARGGVGHGVEAEGGVVYYSGADGDLRPFRTPWGRWPKWSELYLYTLIGEGTTGRAHVAAWENIAAPRLNLHRPLSDQVTARLGLNYLLAPANGWEARGLLTQLELKARFGGGATGHLLWEILAPGEFHDGRYGLPPLTDTIHFLRWQIAWSL